MPLYLYNGGIIVVDGALAADTNCCCGPSLICCPDSPGTAQIDAEDLDNALEGGTILNFGFPLESDPESAGTTAWIFQVSDSWGCDDSDVTLDLECIDGVYYLTIPNNQGGLFPGVGPTFTVAATSQSCDPFELVFEFTADVDASACWTAKVGQHFRFTVTAAP